MISLSFFLLSVALPSFTDCYSFFFISIISRSSSSYARSRFDDEPGALSPARCELPLFIVFTPFVFDLEVVP